MASSDLSRWYARWLSSLVATLLVLASTSAAGALPSSTYDYDVTSTTVAPTTARGIDPPVQPISTPSVVSGFNYDSADNLVATNTGGTGLVPSSTVSLGRWGEARLGDELAWAGVKPSSPFSTTLGNRYVDRLVDGVAYEAKAGLNVQLTASIETQILKDAELVATGQIEAAHWYFFRGASDDVLSFLKGQGILYTVYP